ncbi:alpha/beta hydrolase [Micromonospora sp. SL1-18]|uniref:alpha/beta hydrolase n=1 Tax=Micromonospora sp. SL1-18 TaxID=3399128 RepID=UPI003A4D23EC
MAAPTERVDTIVLIHGLWLTPRSWEHWAERYRARGFQVLAPAWPGLEAEVEELRADPTPIAGQRIADITDHYARIIREQPRPPIIMGHSFGGLIVQLLVARRLSAAAVAVHPVPVDGVQEFPLSTLRSVFPVLDSPTHLHRAVPMSPDDFLFVFGNTMSRQESDAAWERYAIPAAGHVLFEAVFANLEPGGVTKIDSHESDRAPLLLLAGDADHVVPPPVVRLNADIYRPSRALTGYQEFPGRSHFAIGGPGWEEEADFALEWAVEAANEFSQTVVTQAPGRR